jgi:flagellar basal-body rod modification protein FlgD
MARRYRRYRSGARADSVKVEVLSAGGQVIDTIDPVALDAGRHYFSWDAANYQGTAAHPPSGLSPSWVTRRSAQARLSVDKVISVGMDNGAMSLQLQDLGTTPYDSIKAIL